MFRTRGFIFRKTILYTVLLQLPCTCIRISCLAGRRVCSERTNLSYYTCMYNSLPEVKPAGSKRVEDIKKLKTKILIYEMYISLVYIL